MSDCWSDCGMIFYCDGVGYALDLENNTVCIGDEAYVEKILLGEVKVDELKNRKQREVMEIILKYREVNGHGKKSESFKPRGDFRDRFTGDFKRREKSVRRYEKGKRVKVCEVEYEE